MAGGPLNEPDLLTLTRLPDEEAVTRLCARGLCDRKLGLVDFRHPLARDVAYQAIDRSSRARMHRLLGEHLATTPLARGLSAALVARHLARGEAPVPAAELYLEAANAARSTNQVQLAQRYFQRALSLLPAGDARRIAAHDGVEVAPPRFQYGVRICPEPVHWGGLSGCTYSEGVSWGKFVPRAEGGRYAEVYADATVVWPLLVRGVLERLGKVGPGGAGPGGVGPGGAGAGKP